MILNYKNIVTLGLALVVLSVGAREPEFKVKRGNKGSVKATSANCAAASAVSLLAFNNVAARIENGGSIWLDRGTSSAGYAVPKSAVPQTFAIFAGALWMGGLSPDNQLKLAAVTFRQSGNNDFWPGPLTNDGTAEISQDECTEWDRFFVTSKAEVSQFRAQFVEGGNADVPNGIETWPAHGGSGQDDIIAPFYDYDGDGFYDPENGDYPGYDLVGDVECRSNSRFVPLFGDTTIYWVFNDKGNSHTETNSEPIGMEIRAQAFAFSSEDEVNNMTFYNYVLINQGSQTLTNTFFGQWVDSDLGNAADDFVGCDVQRGLGFCYNGDNTDEDGQQGQAGYGETPPAIGIDFFEGPFQDNDYIDRITGDLYVGFRDSLDAPYDNPLTNNAQDAYDNLGIPYAGLGIGYGDGKGNNERFGMRKFIYYNIGAGVNGDPTQGAAYYNYLRGIWQSTGGNMVYGGNGIGTSGGTGDPNQPADFMFPGTTDELGFGTGGSIQSEWTENTAGNQPGDRRFMQSAGPFTLTPGAVNNITVGVVYARAKSGGAQASVASLKIADDKAQQLFDNCFQILEGPDAPDLTVKEYDQELIIYITNPNTSNNNIKFNEDYIKIDPRATNPGLNEKEKSYVFQGYKVYQLKGQDISIADIEDPEKARLIFQCDIKDTISRLINYTLDPDLKLPIPKIMVDGSNEGIKHSFKVTTDPFAQGNNLLINHKTYYFVAIAFASNQYETYNPVDLTGQSVQYLSSRKNGRGGSISSTSGIPHKLKPNQKINVSYGEGIPITRLEGRGNGFNTLKISDETREKMLDAKILADPATNRYQSIGLDTIEYEQNGGPISVQIIDPLKVKPGKYEISIIDENFSGADAIDELDDALFEIVRYDFEGNEEYRDTTGTPLVVGSELYYEEFGIAITVLQYKPGKLRFSGGLPPDGQGYASNALPSLMLNSEMVFEDENNKWLSPISDAEGLVGQNWILSGTYNGGTETDVLNYRDILEADPNDEYENILDGSWAPFNMVAGHKDGPVRTDSDGQFRFEVSTRTAYNPNVDIILTPDTSKWTRSVVLEMGDNVSGVNKGMPRAAASVDKMGNTGTTEANLISPTGMGWFPGYAVDVETGDRLNIAFGEDSRLSSDNGEDMLYNPTYRLNGRIVQQDGSRAYYAAGKHYVFVFRNTERELGNGTGTPAYDGGLYTYSMLRRTISAFRKRVWSACSWVGFMRLSPPDIAINNGEIEIEREYEWLSSDVRISLRLARPYERITSDTLTFAETAFSKNNWNPKYLFEIPESYKVEEVDAASSGDEVKDQILDLIGIVPNPYYSYASYETGKLDTRVKFTNLPVRASIRIFTANGTLVKTIEKDSELSYIDWNLKNEVNIPISSGTYIIHIDVPGVGEKVMKWFGVMRKPALQNL
jgi:hypothetical protein